MYHVDVVWLTGLEWGSGSSVEDPDNGVNFQLPNPLTALKAFGLDAKFLTQQEGRCSYLQVQQNQYHDNIAKYAGGVIYSTDCVSLNITCKEHTTVDNASLDCGLPSWGGNNIGAYGYGPVIAFPPARVDTDLPPRLTYVSNGVSKLSITAQVLDAAGTHITTGVTFLNDLLINQHAHKVILIRVFAICTLIVNTETAKFYLPTYLTCMMHLIQWRLKWHACTLALDLEMHDMLHHSSNTRLKVRDTDDMIVGTTNQAPLRASISVKTLMMPPYDIPAPFLQGQTQAEADESGVMRIDDMILSAIPGVYALVVTLPDYPQVMGSTNKTAILAPPTLDSHVNICPFGSITMTSISPVKHCILAC